MRKQFILDGAKIKKVRKVLGVFTDTEAVNQALDIVLANVQIQNLHRRLSGKVKIRDMDQSHFHA